MRKNEIEVLLQVDKGLVVSTSGPAYYVLLEAWLKSTPRDKDGGFIGANAELAKATVKFLKAEGEEQ